ncbi:MAG: M23 family metallopeptidase [Aliidiomarina sp.]|uniref:M23 family metallopeptidase n=1 Tax=Aliidiomarina sp. TaxID=1872439 RepID=UPI0025BA89F0|nr:M23 family metallopeptidase [Aliidiomarina sp.]MCH8500764.1 M23 family metallopeptidase [Aliidiomarina sp.]
MKNRDWLKAWYTPIFFALPTYFLLMFALQMVADVDLNRWLKLGLYFALYFFFVWFLAKIANAGTDLATERHPAYDWPISGPIRYVGKYVFFLTFYPTLILSSLNPFQFVQQFRQIFGQAKAAKRLQGNEETNANYQTKATYRLPFSGEWLVFNGGLKEATSHSWQVLAQRYAYDFVQADAEFRRHRGQGMRLRDYFCYDQPILAAADGEVVDVVDKIGPAPLVGFGIADFLCRHFAGNHVVIRHADGEYGFYAHLIKGTIPVKIGDFVKAGEEIGRCGHTGHSSEPHLHFHLQDTPSIFTGMGLPIRFHGVGEIVRGQRVVGTPVSSPN